MNVVTNKDLEEEKIMLVVTENRTINLDKFEAVRYRESVCGNGYPVEAIRYESGFLGRSVIESEIIRFESEKNAKSIVKAITEAWINGDNSFYVEEWLNKDKE